MTVKPLGGLRVLLIEDEALLASLMEDQLEALGCVCAGTALALDDAMEKARSTLADVAVLDLSLAGRSSTPVADILRDRDIPFVLATGHDPDGVPDGLRGRPVLRKPFRQEQLASALAAADER